MKKLIGKWWVWLIGTLLFLILVQIVFSIPCWPFEWAWTAGDLISFVGTMVLGFVAVTQTQKANSMSERLMQIEENRYRLETRPFVIVSEVKAYILNFSQIRDNPDKLYIVIGDLGQDGAEIIGLGMRFVNTTNSWISLKFDKGDSDKYKLDNGMFNQPNPKIMPGETDEIVFYAARKSIFEMRHKITTFDFILENRFAKRYKETFDMILMDIKAGKDTAQKEMECYANVQNYKIYRFEKSSDGKNIAVSDD